MLAWWIKASRLKMRRIAKHPAPPLRLHSARFAKLRPGNLPVFSCCAFNMRMQTTCGFATSWCILALHMTPMCARVASVRRFRRPPRLLGAPCHGAVIHGGRHMDTDIRRTIYETRLLAHFQPDWNRPMETPNVRPIRMLCRQQPGAARRAPDDFPVRLRPL